MKTLTSLRKFVSAVRQHPLDQSQLPNPHIREAFAFKTVPTKLGVVTYPCCPYCGARQGPDNEKFLRGRLCSKNLCHFAWQLKFNRPRFAKIIRQECLVLRTARNNSTDGASI